ncbi:MAG: hypothetical protein U0U66_04540 [Cytophagaceae bacterium]
MTAYKIEDIIKAVLVKEAYILVKTGLMSQEDWEKLKTTHTTFQQNSKWFIRILFFLLGVLLLDLIIGFLALFIFLNNSSSNDGLYLCILGLMASVAGAEIIARAKYYAHGLSDAFIIGIQVMTFITIFTILIDLENPPIWVACLGLSISSLYCYKRFVHSMSLLISVVAFIATIIALFIQLGTITTLLLPFVLMLISIGIFYTSKTWGQKTKDLLLCKDLYVLYYLSFVLFYLASNYFIIREASNELLYKADEVATDIQFSYFFQACSYLLPIGYIALGLWWRDRMILWIGIVVGIIGVFTFRYYHHILPTEIVLTLSGSILLAASLYLIKKLKHATEGFTFQKDPTQDSFTAMDLEILQSALKNINSSIDIKPKTDFNGGSSSGGGASGSY